MTDRAAIALAGSLVLAVAPIGAQRVTETPIGTPTATNPTQFALIGGVRERSDGSLLVVDPIDNVIRRVDEKLAEIRPLGRTGSGPGEYKQPDGIWALPADSALVVDLGNTRLMEFGPRMTPGGTYPMVAGGDGGPGSMTLMLIGGADAHGNLYFRGGSPMEDSSTVFRFDRNSKTTAPAAKVKGPEIKRVSSGGPNDQSVSMRQVPLSAEDGWSVSRSGAIYAVRASDYHVDVILPSGKVISGAPVPFRPVPIGQAEKEEWNADRQRTGGVSIGVEMNNGQRSVSMGRGRGRESDLDGLPWPETKPPFVAAETWVDGKDRLWVRRSQKAGEDRLFDVFDTSAEHVGSVRLGAERTIVGMGSNSVYLGRYDEDDLQYLERYDLPL